jgi:hypothetical protein
MKNIFFTLSLLQLTVCTLFAQEDMDKMRKDFEAQMKNMSGIPYGNNKAAGKYYPLRGFNMYCEVYGNG